MVPASPWLSKKGLLGWLGGRNATTPRLEVKSAQDRLELNWGDKPGKVNCWVLQKQTAGQWSTEIIPAAKTSYTIKADGTNALPGVVALTMMDRYGNTGKPAVFQVKH